MRLRPLLFALLSACTLPAPPPVTVNVPPAVCAAPAEERPNEDPRRAFVRSHYAKFEYRVPMRDGTRLFTSVYVPNDASANKTYPMLLVRTPYGVAPYGADRYREALGPEASYEKEGFIFVFQDVRGRHMSEGQFVDMRPMLSAQRGAKDFDESTDAFDTIDWLLKNVEHHNGRVGQWGISYPGFYAAAAAIDGHPALKAISPQAPIADWFRGDDMHRHGAFNLQMSFAFFSGFGKERKVPAPDETWKGYDFDTPDAYRFYLGLPKLSEVETRYFEGKVPFWRELVAHPNYDAFWQARNLLPHLRNVRAAMLVVGGFYDAEDLYGPLQVHRAIKAQNPRIENTLVMGPWKHGGWHRSEGDSLGDAHFGFATSEVFRPLELAFFLHHLKDGPDPKLPEALVFEGGANRFRAFDAWPPRQAMDARLFLREGFSISRDAPTEANAFDEYLSDPSRPVPYTQEVSQRWSSGFMAEDQRFAAQRPDVLVYESAPLEDDLTLAGPLVAELFVSSTGTDADFVVKLIDENPGKPEGEKDPDGATRRGSQQTLVRGEPFPARFRDGYETPKALVAGEVTKLRFELNDVFYTFQRGHRLVVHVQSSWFPFIARNPQVFVANPYEAEPSRFVKATQRVHRAKEAPSSLTVRVLAGALP